MKKIVLLLLLLCLTGCLGAESAKPDAELERQIFIGEARAEGVEVDFGEDGSIRSLDSAEGKYRQSSEDGSWTFTGRDGTQAQGGGFDWPDNEFTRRIPRPDFDFLSPTQTRDTFNVSFPDADVAQLRAYVRKLLAMGFTVKPQIQDQTVMGMVIYNYTAKDAAGYEVSVFSVRGMTGLNLKKP